MASAPGLIIGAGGLTFAASFIKSEGFPSNGYSVIGGTVALAFLASTTGGSPIASPVKALAALMLLVAVYTSVPVLTETTKRKRKSRNG